MARTCYYAHCMSIYDTPQEKRDIDLLEELGWTVSNPNTTEVRRRLEGYTHVNPDAPKLAIMEAVFRPMVTVADVCAIRALPDGSISSGVYRELVWAKDVGAPVIELPTGVERRHLSLELTREYLHEVGQR